jgi:signal peptidase II
MRVLWFAFAILALDQVSKTLVHLFMVPGQSISVIGEVLKFTYTTNPGMAFGLQVGPKLFLTVFSIAATIGLIWYLWMVRRGPVGYRLALAAVIGGALGNVIDRTFYGVIYGYAPLFHGDVKDFIHVDLWRGFVDIPLLGPQFIPLFPIWNVADMGIVLGVVAIILTQKSLRRSIEERLEGEGGESAATEPDDAAAGAPSEPRARAVDGHEGVREAPASEHRS